MRAWQNCDLYYILSENRLRWLNALLGQFLQSHLFITKLWFWYAFKFSREYSQAFTNKWNIFHLNKPAQKAPVVMSLSSVMMLVSPWYCDEYLTLTPGHSADIGGNDEYPGEGCYNIGGILTNEIQYSQAVTITTKSRYPMSNI